MSETNELTEHFFRHNYARMIAILAKYFGLKEISLIEDIVQDTLVEAMEKWSVRDIPYNPEGWLMDVAKKKAINYLKRDQNFRTKILPGLNQESIFEMEKDVQGDDTLRMIFACCHPNIPTESQISLALKTLCGLSVKEIASALLTSEGNINKRLYRTKQKFRKGEIPFNIPKSEILDERLDGVIATLYLLFNEGYYSSNSNELIRIDLCFEAIRLVRQITEFYPTSGRAKALLSLMYLSVSRFESRVGKEGATIILSKQDRNLWDKDLIAQGIYNLSESMDSKALGTYHLQAGIAAEHCLAKDFQSTNWKSIYEQYLLLEQLSENAIFAMNRCIAKFYGYDRKEALQDLIALGDRPELQKNVHYFTSVAIFYTELNQKEKAIPFFETALGISDSKEEKSMILNRMGT